MGRKFVICVLEVDPQHSIDANYNKEGLPTTGEPVAWERDIEEHMEKLMADPKLRFEGYDSFEIERVFLKPSPLGRLAICEIRKRARYVTVFFNLYDLSDDTAQRITDFMIDHGIAFTGCGGRHYDPTRHDLKRVCQACGVGTAPFSFCYDDQDLDRVVEECGGFPLFVKPEQGFDSVGIDDKSLCVDMHSLKTKVNQVSAAFGGVLVERYLDGQEYSVLIAGDGTILGKKEELVVFQPICVQLGDDSNPGAPIKGAKFLSFDLKYIHNALDHATPLPSSEVELKKNLEQMCISVYRAFEMTGFARFDIRMDTRTKELCILDLNPNCSIFFKGLCTADTIIKYTEGWSMTRFLHFLLSHALTRQQRHRDNNKWAPKCDTSKKAMRMSLVATQNLQEGELIYSDEMLPLRLVTKDVVDKQWTNQSDLEWFRDYAWPIGPNTYVTWNSESKHWRPINHSCEPNTWMDGLSVRARQAIRKGEELTIDYATFLDHPMDFECWCGSKLCRKRMAVEEYKTEWFQSRYWGHCSPYINSLMEAHPHPDRVKSSNGSSDPDENASKRKKH